MRGAETQSVKIGLDPFDVIKWVSVLVFIAVAIAGIALLIRNVLDPNANEYLTKKIIDMFLMQVAAIGVAVFGKSLGITIDRKAEDAS